MKIFKKFMYLVFLWLMVFISPAFASTGTCDGMDLFGMKCCIEKGISAPQGLESHDTVMYFSQSGNIYQNTFSGEVLINSGTQRYRYVKMLLERRNYQNIKWVQDFFIGEKKFTVTLGTKCNHPEVRVNEYEYRNDLNIFDIKADTQYLRFYYYQDGNLNALRCKPKSYEGELSDILSGNNQNTSPLEGLSPRPQSGENLDESTKSQQEIQANTGENLLIKPIILNNLKTYRELKNQAPYQLVKQRGMDRKTVRKDLAKQAGLDPTTYKGTKTQNLIIKDFLLKKITLNIQATKTPDITISQEEYKKIQSLQLWRMVGLRDYIWQKDRVSIAMEYGFDPKIYFGTKSQNLKIRNWLLEKIHQE